MDIWVRELPAASPGDERSVRITRSAATKVIRRGRQTTRVSRTRPRAAARSPSGSRWYRRSTAHAACRARWSRRRRARWRGRRTQPPRCPTDPSCSRRVTAVSRRGLPTARPSRSPRSRRAAAATTAIRTATTTIRRPRWQVRSQYALWRVLAPRAVDDGAQSLTLAASDAARWTSAFDQVWQTMKTAVLRDRAVGCRVGRASGEIPAADGAGERRGRR